MAESIPDAEMISFDSGGHPLLGYEDRIQTAVETFISEHQ